MLDEEVVDCGVEGHGGFIAGAYLNIWVRFK